MPWALWWRPGLGFAIDLPTVIHPIVIMMHAMLVGGIYGWIPGVLKVKLKINEVITTHRDE